MVPLIERNIDLNIPASSQRLRGAITAAGYAWGQSKAALGGETFDAILMADVVYDPKARHQLCVNARVGKLTHRDAECSGLLRFSYGL